ncbi:MAG: MFS transporter, partial [Asticcacaulis sp.]|nr:MFS transporter [Asticcacaulis sp.]
MLFGFDTVVISGVVGSIRSVFEIEQGSFWDGFAVAVGLVGTFLGALFAGKPGDRYGSCDSLKVVGTMYVVSAIGCAACWSFGSFCAFRFLGGVAIGASSVLAPVYISEIAPAQDRGRLTGLFQFNIVLGIVLAYLSTAFVAMTMNGADPWRTKLGVAALPALLFFAMMYTIPQSPRWLAQRGRHDEARA